MDVALDKGQESSVDALLEAPIPPTLKPFNETYSLAGNSSSLVFDHEYRQIVAGDFKGYFRVDQQNADLVLLNDDLTLNNTFKVGKKFTSIFQQNSDSHKISKVLPVSDGIIVVGNFDLFDGQPLKNIIKLKPDGSRDLSFHEVSLPFSNAAISNIAIHESKILIGGTLHEYCSCPTASLGLMRLNLDGTPDTVFNDNIRNLSDKVGVSDFAIDSLNRIVLVYNRSLKRLNSDGTLDGSLDPAMLPPGSMYIAVAVSGNNIYAAGQLFYNSTHRNIIKFSDTGVLDSAFNNGQIIPTTDGVRDLKVLTNGNILIVGHLTSIAGTSIKGLGILNPSTGAPIPGFTLDSDITKGYAVNENTADGSMTIAGLIKRPSSTLEDLTIVKIDTSGNITERSNLNIFSGGTTSTFGSPITDIIEDSQGNFYVMGGFYNTHYTEAAYLLRFTINGDFDSTFNQGTGFNGKIENLLVTASGKYIATGTFTQYNGETVRHIAVLNEDGSLDKSGTGEGFSGGTAITTITPLDKSSMKFLITTYHTSYNGTAARRFFVINEDGSLDNGFESKLDPSFDYLTIENIAVSGKHIYISSWSTGAYLGHNTGYVFRLKLDGTFDPTFTTLSSGGASLFDNPLGISGLGFTTELSDGRVLIGGEFSQCGNATSQRVVILTSTGACDTLFGQRFEYDLSAGTINWRTFPTSDGRAAVFTTEANRDRDNGQLLDTLFIINKDGSIDNQYYQSSSSLLNATGGLANFTVTQDSLYRLQLRGDFAQFKGQPAYSFLWLNSDLSVRQVKSDRVPQNTVTGVVCRVSRCVFSYAW